MNAFQLASTQTFRQGFTVEPIGLHPLSWSSGDHRWSGDQAPIPLSRKPIIQPVPCGSSLIGKGHLLIRKVVVYMVQQVLHFIRHAQGSDESLMTAKSCRDALFVHVQAGKHIILSGDKRLVSHRSASFGQCLLFQALYQSTRIENRHPSYKSQEGKRTQRQEVQGAPRRPEPAAVFLGQGEGVSPRRLLLLERRRRLDGAPRSPLEDQLS